MTFRDVINPMRVRRYEWPPGWYMQRQYHRMDGTTWTLHGDGLARAMGLHENATTFTGHAYEVEGDDWEVAAPG